MRKSIVTVTILTGVLTLLSGCTTIGKLKEKMFGDGRDYMIHLHTFTATRTEENQMRGVEYIPGKFIYPELTPVISSMDIKKIEVLDMPTGKSLKLVLDGHGRTAWTHTTALFRGKRVVIMVDDKYRGWIPLANIVENGIIILPGPFGDDEVKKIVEHAEANRKK